MVAGVGAGVPTAGLGLSFHDINLSTLWHSFWTHSALPVKDSLFQSGLLENSKANFPSPAGTLAFNPGVGNTLGITSRFHLNRFSWLAKNAAVMEM